ncbi:hypothetical protein LTR84_012793 [Exophiala bonariae]|uniref:Uncharacterized protein n=1 Tax=Exophiala bonariae TaxID=1690606 RepID=A0AAV9NG23_9EURO|nr:hypothetical protein LTR84_012793 [Exophiala bonariae]
MTSLSSAAAKRRVARHSRLSKARGRHMAHPDPTLARRTPRSRTRRLRDQEALNLDDCFHHCEDLGYHIDPDVHIGRAVVQSVNPFSILDPDSSEFPSSLLNTPSGDESLPEWPKEDYRQNSCSLPSTVPDKSDVVLDARPLTNTYTDYMAPGFPDDVFASEADPTVRMSGSFSGVSSSGTDDTFNSGFYLDNIRIPSPLLYHRSSSKACTPDTETPSDLPDFELAHGQPVPEPDFVTYRNVPHDDVHTSTQAPLIGIYSPLPTNAFVTFLGHKREKPQRASSSTDSNQTAHRGQTSRGSGGSDILHMPGGFQCYMEKNDIDKGHVYGSLPPTSHHTVKTNDDDVIFPKLSISSQDQPCNISAWNPSVVKPWHAMAKRSLLRGIELKLAFTSPPAPCRDLVLASTFPKELALSPGRRWSCDATFNSIPNDGHREIRKVALPLERPKLSIESEYHRQTQRSDASAGGEIEKTKSPPEKFDSLTPSCHGALMLPSPLSETDDEDKGYFSSYEICTDAEIIDLNESDADWSDWEGDFEVEQINGIDTQ